jgi:hypothetical protein
LPHEAPPKPPIELPDALQPVAMAEQPADREAEARAIDALAKDGPNAALPLMRKSIASNQATHRVWRTYLNVLETLSLNEELLEKARVYATRHPDRLEAAHFLARGLLRQDINKYRTGWSGYISQAFKADLAAAQKRLEQACDLLDKHKGDWSHKSRTAWRSLLLLDRASLYEQQWKCEGAPVAHEFRDAAIEALEKLQAKNARNAIELRLRIYKEIERQMWSWSSSKVVINGKAYSKQLLADRIKELEENLRQNHEDDES